MANKKNVIAFMVVIALVGILVLQIFRLYKENYIYRGAVSQKIRIETEKQEYLRNLDKIKDIIKASSGGISVTDITKAAMEFVHDNSSHLIDDEHRRYAFNIPIVVKKLLMTYHGKKNEKPHLSCGPRSFVMREVLDRFGITSRLVQVFSDEYYHVKGHRLLEVFNRDRKEWEVWDPDYRVTYFDRYSKKPVDIMCIVFGDINRIVPKNGNVKGWEETDTEHLRKNYFKAFSLERFDQGLIEGTMNTTIVVNRAKFKINKVFSGGLTFEQWAIKHYQHPRFIVFP
jgi:hypothetical protein